MAVTYIPNPVFAEEWKVSPEAAAFAEECGVIVAALAEEKAPFLTGALESSITSEVMPGADGGYMARVAATDYKASWHEFGTRYMHAHPYLLPALTEGLPGAVIISAGGSGGGGTAGGTGP
jgi:hypothetical protein